MKVALVSPYDIGRFGGVQNQVTLLAAALRSRGHDAWVVAPGDSATQPVRSLGKSMNWSVNDSTAPIKLNPVLVGRMRAAVADADVVHVHEPLMPLVGLAARWTGRPLVGTFHADPSSLIRNIYRYFAPLKWHLRSFRSLAAVSETAASAVKEFGDVHLIPNGIVTSGLPHRDRVPERIAFVGRNDPRKGLDVALAAFPAVLQARPAAHLVVITPDAVTVGEGVSVYRGIDDEAKADLLASSEIYIAPNRRGESFGLTVAEGMAAGAACVVSDIPAFAAVVEDAAMRVPPGSANALRDGIVELLENRTKLQELAAAGHARAEQFSIDKTVEGYLPLYERAAALP
ncbi:MAG: glycosyltransferase family 4 protein [Acidimicrobiia bacterium]|nr:glycosyltransferase family 4 protein [Acidimicrobiia bacterium]